MLSGFMLEFGGRLPILIKISNLVNTIEGKENKL